MLFIYIYKKKMIIYAAGAGAAEWRLIWQESMEVGIALTERVLDNLWTRQTVTLNNIAK